MPNAGKRDKKSRSYSVVKPGAKTIRPSMVKQETTAKQLGETPTPQETSAEGEALPH